MVKCWKYCSHSVYIRLGFRYKPAFQKSHPVLINQNSGKPLWFQLTRTLVPFRFLVGSSSSGRNLHVTILHTCLNISNVQYIMNAFKICLSEEPKSALRYQIQATPPAPGLVASATALHPDILMFDICILQTFLFLKLNTAIWLHLTLWYIYRICMR